MCHDHHSAAEPHAHGCSCHAHDCCHEPSATRRAWLAPLLSLIVMGGALAATAAGLFDGRRWLELAVWAVAWLPVGFPVLHSAVREALEGEVFSEYMLMGVASLAAFAIGEWGEAVAVVLLWSVGEWLQDKATDRADDDIRALSALRPDVATVVGTDGRRTVVPAAGVAVGQVVEVPAGGRVPLDGELLNPAAWFDTAALTGESEPRSVEAGGEVSAGVVAVGQSVRLRVVRPVADSALSHIEAMVRDARSRKAPVELLIRRFARIYTPVVTLLAVLLAVVPPLVAAEARWADYVYRACAFLVVSCPCALVISVPLAYFFGIGVGSRRGILFKGGSSLDAVARLNAVVFDKTGTLTQGAFSVVGVRGCGMAEADVLRLAAALEARSTHPVGRAIVGSAGSDLLPEADAVEELSGRGLRGTVGGRVVLVGNRRLLDEQGVSVPETLVADETLTTVFVAADGQAVGLVELSDAPKAGAAGAVARLRELGVERVEVLSGDRQPIVERLARTLGADAWAGDLLPEDKMERLQALKDEAHWRTAFVGDGINDAPALALADVGFAMAQGGADVAVETADIVVRSGEPQRVAEAVGIGRMVRRVVVLNIVLALGVKLLVLLLSAFGRVELWLAVFADTGVALWCVANVFFISRRHGKAKKPNFAV